MAAWVYVVSDRRGHVKVGMSDDVASRLAGLQGANPLPLVLEMTVGPMERDEAHRLECRTHSILERCRTERGVVRLLYGLKGSRLSARRDSRWVSSAKSADRRPSSRRCAS